MARYRTFSDKLALSFAGLVALALVVAAIALYALGRVVRSKDHVIDANARALALAGDIEAATYQKSAAIRGYLLTGRPDILAREQAAATRFRRAMDGLERVVDDEDARGLLPQIQAADAEFDRHVRTMQAMKDGGTPTDAIARYMVNEALPQRAQLEALVARLSDVEQRRMEEGRRASTQAAASSRELLLAIAALAVVAAVLLAAWLGRLLAGQIGAAVQDMQSSSAELHTTSAEQATGARQQATAMGEITTTMTELLATSRQIAESAQRVTGVSKDAAEAARGSDRVVQRAQESVGGIKRQVDAVVTHMLDLGRKSQQIGGIVEIINELAEQTNILAINAHIEAAGAGDAGRRFAVVADEIRKLADRVGGSTREIRALVDEVRAAVNTTVMATESGSKAVDAGTRDFAEVAQALRQIVALASTTSEAAREIELSTKQQSTAVEQVNMAVASVAQVSREAETSTAQAMQTASELAAVSRRLAQLIRAEAAA